MALGVMTLSSTVLAASLEQSACLESLQEGSFHASHWLSTSPAD